MYCKDYSCIFLANPSQGDTTVFTMTKLWWIWHQFAKTTAAGWYFLGSSIPGKYYIMCCVFILYFRSTTMYLTFIQKLEELEKYETCFLILKEFNLFSAGIYQWIPDVWSQFSLKDIHTCRDICQTIAFKFSSCNFPQGVNTKT